VSVKSKRPYLLRALFEWIIDSELTPYVLIAASDPGVIVPRQYVNDGKIVLNVSPSAVRDLFFDDDFVRFNGRFGGTAFAVEAPISQVLAIYAKETGEGMMFDPEESSGESSPAKESQDEKPVEKQAGPGAHLKIIK
jgi:stringent starvation protein B